VTAVRAALRRAPAILVLAGCAAACGPSAEERLGAEAAAAADPVIAAFAADLDAGRVEQARLRATSAFQSAATPDAIRTVVEGQSGVLGRLVAREPAEVLGLVSSESQQGPVARAVVLAVPARFEKGRGRIETRLERGAADGLWRVDSWSVTSALFQWSLR
jgi:hypothetical protein